MGFAPEYKNYLTGRKLANSPDYSCDNAMFNFAMNWYSLKILRTLSTAPAKQASAIINSMNNGKQYDKTGSESFLRGLLLPNHKQKSLCNRDFFGKKFKNYWVYLIDRKCQKNLSTVSKALKGLL